MLHWGGLAGKNVTLSKVVFKIHFKSIRGRGPNKICIFGFSSNINVLFYTIHAVQLSCPAKLFIRCKTTF